MKKTIMINSFWSVVCKIVLVIFAFIERKVFLQTLGVEVLGISGSLTSLIAVVSLADMGFGTAIIFHLYEPLERKDYDEVNRLLSVYRRLYGIISLLVVAFAVIISPFLKYFLSGIVVSREIYVFFGLIAANTAMTYVLSYKRCLFMADKKDYICKLVDLVCSVTFFAIEIALLLITRNYILFLLVALCKTIMSNLIVHFLCNRFYSEYKRVRFEKSVFRKLIPDFKNLWGGQIAAYIFNSTDNIVISTFVGTVSVGFLSGYEVILSNFKMLFSAIFGSFSVYLGRMRAASEKSVENVIMGKEMYSFATFIFSLLIIVPEAALLQNFVGTVWGENTTLSNSTVVLLLIEQYFALQHEPSGGVLIAMGDFYNSKKADTFAAISNIIFSLVLVGILGIDGVIIGTIVGDLGKCIIKSYYALLYNLEIKRSEYCRHIVKEILKVFIAVVTCVVAVALCSVIRISNFVGAFVIGGILSEVTAIVILVLVFSRTNEFKQLINYIIRKSNE